MDELLERLEELDDDDDESSLDGTLLPDIETSAPLVDQSEVCTSWVYFRISPKHIAAKLIANTNPREQPCYYIK